MPRALTHLYPGSSLGNRAFYYTGWGGGIQLTGYCQRNRKVGWGWGVGAGGLARNLGTHTHSSCHHNHQYSLTYVISRRAANSDLSNSPYVSTTARSCPEPSSRKLVASFLQIDIQCPNVFAVHVVPELEAGTRGRLVGRTDKDGIVIFLSWIRSFNIHVVSCRKKNKTKI